jgi:uncharacterized membrane protein YdfJ with MMPL/SSD domain
VRLARVVDLVATHRRVVVATWVCLLVGTGYFSLHQADRLSASGWEVPGSQSARAGKLLRGFPGFAAAAHLVFVTGSSPADVSARTRTAATYVSRQPDLRPGPVRTFEGGRAALFPVDYAGPADGVIDTAKNLRDGLVETTPQTQTRLIGVPASWSEYQEVAKRQLAMSELIGFPLILVILLGAFGTLVGALAPVAIGFVSVLVTGGLIWAISHGLQLSVYVTNIASMIGIGVAVDYSLFILSRFRRELHAGAEEHEALRRAYASAGGAVVSSGATVAASLCALYLIDVNAVRSLATGAILVVLVSVGATVTLLPALLSIVGGRIDRLRAPLPWATGEEGNPRLWQRWTDGVMAHPALALASGVALMLALASPLLAMRAYNRGLEELPRGSEVRAATDRVQRLAGPGSIGPVHVILRNRDEAAAVQARLRSVPGVASVGPVVGNGGGDAFLVDAVLADDPESTAARTTYQQIRAVAPDAVVGGSTAFDLAVEHAVVGGLWRMVVFILAISFAILVLVLRSVLLPLKALVMNMLSVGASYGVLVAVFQWGWLDWTGYDSPGYIGAVVPALVLAVTFGLSMDYEVFLLTRIRERYQAGGRNELAVSEGLVASARVITSAALVMVAVFAAFAISGGIILRELGIGLAVAIALDATLVRLVIVPAAMRLLGDWNWWLPRPLARALALSGAGGGGGSSSSFER